MRFVFLSFGSLGSLLSFRLFSVCGLVVFLHLLADLVVVLSELGLIDNSVLVLIASSLNLDNFGGSNGLFNLALRVEGAPDPFGELG